MSYTTVDTFLRDQRLAGVRDFGRRDLLAWLHAQGWYGYTAADASTLLQEHRARMPRTAEMCWPEGYGRAAVWHIGVPGQAERCMAYSAADARRRLTKNLVTRVAKGLAVEPARVRARLATATTVTEAQMEAIERTVRAILTAP